MFGRRCDGVEIKDMGIIEKATAYFMPMRIDAVNLYTNSVDCEAIDRFIKEQRANGIHYTYNDIFIASAVRTIYERPKINRFIKRCVMFQRNDICISMAVKRSLDDDGEEMTLKFHFKGTETLPEIKEIIDTEISKHCKCEKIDQSTVNTAGVLCYLPNWLFRLAIRLLNFLDNHGMLSRSILEASPFHTSMFVSNLKSIKLGRLHHHLYNFGTTTMFATLPKEEYRPTSDRLGQIKTSKIVDIGMSLDERVCDGMYYSNTLRFWNTLLGNPNLMLERPVEREIVMSKKFNKKYKKSLAKEQKFQAKLKMKEEKKALKKARKVKVA